MPFEFATAARIVFGPGVLAGVGEIAREFGRHALVVTGRDTHRARPLLDRLDVAGIASTVFSLAGEPTVEDVSRGTSQARTAGCDLVIAIGGGSAIDAAKAISALLTNPGEPLDYVEVVGRGRSIGQWAAPCIAIPTTAGTGSEVTRNAVLSAPAPAAGEAAGGTAVRVKASIRSARILPRVALVDPALTHGLPPHVTAATGLDALTQLIEPFVSTRANPLTDAICAGGLRRIARSLRTAFRNGGDAAAREDMALASLSGGLALANAGLGAVHGFAAPIGGMFRGPHGAVCAALLPHVMEANLRALRDRAPHHPALPRYDEIARLLTGEPQAVADGGTDWIRQVVADLAIPPLRTYGIRTADIPRVVEAAINASSMKANPLPLTSTELAAILERAI
jgi:alcohol dehydrogenase class IV